MLQNSRKRSVWIVPFLVVSFIVFSLPLAVASTGSDWLSSKIQPDGNYQGDGDISTVHQSTAEVLRTFRSLGETTRPGITGALQFLEDEPYQSTEFLARRIIAGISMGREVSVLVDELLSGFGPDGGIGELPGYGSTSLDTAFALEALSIAGVTGGETVGYALGYLLSRQHNSGAWFDGANEDSVYITALALHTAWRFRHLFIVEEELTLGRAWLLNQRDLSGSWGEPWLDALALIAILPTLPDTTAVQPGIDQLRQAQQADGSWDRDVFATALALRALKLADSPVPDPDLGTIRGRLIDADSGLALSGATLSIEGQANHNFVTGTDGVFEFTGLTAGAYTLVITLPEYGTLTTTFNLTLGGLVDLATLNLLKDTGSATTGTVRGTITTAGTFEPLSGVTVTVGALNATSSDDGSYQISNVPAGQVLVVAGKPGYYSASGSADVMAGGSLIFSPLLSPAVEPPPPEPATLFGTVSLADTGLPLAGATVSVNGATNLDALTDSQGRFRLSPLNEGLTTVQAAMTGYDTVTGEILVTASAQITFAPELHLIGTSPVNDAALSGTVTDILSGLPLAGATVTLTGSSEIEIQTDDQGRYLLEPLNEGLLYIAVNLEGYDNLTAETLVVAGQQIEFSPGLFVEGTAPVKDAALYGTITDADTGLPLAGVAVSVIGATVLDTLTDADGRYRLEPLNTGLVGIAADLTGYDPVIAEASLTPGLQIAFSPALYSTDATPQGENSASVTAVVVNSGTNAPLENTVVEAAHDGILETLQTDSDGRFILTGVNAAQVELNISREGYVPVELSLPVTPLATLDAGQVRLRPEEVEALLPDLSPTLVDGTNAITDPHTLGLTGGIGVNFANRGTVPLSRDVAVHAFHDANRDDRFEDTIDSLLGSIQLSIDLPVGAETGVVVPVDGELPFRDAPIHVWLDSAESVVELDEENNTSTSANRCRIDPPSLGDFDMVEKWYWGGQPDFSSVNVYGPNLVGQVSDDNGDGQIDDRDTPDVIATVGYLAAISGDTGIPLWVNKDVPVTVLGSAAIGDIDHDGLIEIVVANKQRSRLRAFEHDGTLKWSVVTGPTFSGTHTRDAMAIADLDHDGFAEIIHGRRVYDHQGNFKWQGTGDHGGDINYGTIPIVADIDLQGAMEVIAGRTVYDAGGQIVWRRTDLPSSGGFTAVGNFDEDPYPEIVLVTSGKVYLLEHTGTTKWGPAIIPGSGRGAPTVGDFDGDGEPEIGIAGASRYVVFETDGSIKWQKTTRDRSSYRTGSSLFDFNADGRVEVVYADEYYLRVYDGATGTVLKSKRIGSGTTLEYPVIADIDNDNHAEIVIGSNNSSNSSRRGLLAFEAPEDNWAATRSIWNQHSYHITNINDDGSIPQHEPHSWLVHNSYRLNTFVDRDPLAAPDLSVALLKLVDQGSGQPFSLRVRVGNGGATNSPDGIRLDFHEGDPDTGGPLLAFTTLGELPAGGYRDIMVDGITNYQGGDIYAIADADNQVDECEEGNNLILISGMDQTSPLVGIGVASDRAQYGPDAPVLLQGIVTNTGALSGGFTAQLQIEDLNGVIVQAFVPQPLPDLASNATVPLAETWNSADYLAGTYRLRGMVESNDGLLLQEASSLFEIVHGDTGDTAVTLRTTTDKPVYHSTDQVQIGNLIRNLSSNLLLDGALLRITVLDGASQPIFTIDESLGQLLPGSQVERTRLFNLIAAGEGIYETRVQVIEAGSERLLASDSAGFEVIEDLAISLAGSVQVEHTSLYQGDPQVCTFGLDNRGVSNLPTLPLRERWVDLNNELEIQVDAVEASLPSGASYSSIRGRGTGDLAVGAHGCALQVQMGDSWETLAYGYFQVLEPPIRIDAGMGPGDWGRVLVLLDEGIDDPLGPNHAPDLLTQQNQLESLLQQAGWSYTIVTDKDVFAAELRTGGYAVYLLLSEQIKLDEQVQKELREAVFRGEGLVKAGGHDQRQGRIDEALGIAFKGKHSRMEGIQMHESALHTGSSAPFALDDKQLRVKTSGAVVRGEFIDDTGFTSGEPAVTEHDYGNGRAIHIGFDLLAEATLFEGADNLYAGLILDAIAYAHPSTLIPLAGGVYPLSISLNNEGIATPGRFLLPLPADVQVMDAGVATLDADNGLTWQFDLAETAMPGFKSWLKLPVDPLHLEALIQTGENPDYSDYTTLVLDIVPDAGVQVDDALDAVLALDSKQYKKVKKYLGWAQQDLLRQDPESALNALIRAADALIKIGTAQSDEIRSLVVEVLRNVSQQL